MNEWMVEGNKIYSRGIPKLHLYTDQASTQIQAAIAEAHRLSLYQPQLMLTQANYMIRAHQCTQVDKTKYHSTSLSSTGL